MSQEDVVTQNPEASADCIPGRKRHTYAGAVDNESCIWCNKSKTTVQQARIFAPFNKHPQILTGTEIKIKHLTELFDRYQESRDELINFLSQQRKDKIVIEDLLEPFAGEILNAFYLEHGRETFWKYIEGK